MLRIVSPTGCVHAVADVTKKGWYATHCNHAGWRYQYYHEWDQTSKDVTCKRCLAVLNKKIKHKETGWTRARRSCEHRYPHLRYGVQCKNKCFHGAPDRPRLCESLYCPMPHVPTAATMAEELVHATITEIANDLMRAEKAYKLRFNMIAVHCKHKKPAIQDNSYPHMCSNSALKRNGSGLDPKFGWACRMTHCPHMFKAMLWRANAHR